MSDDKQQLAVDDRKAEQTRELAMQEYTLGNIFSDNRSFALAQRMSQALAASTIVPNDYQGQVGNCLVALELANRLHVSPIMVMQNVDVIHGRPGLRGKFVTALVNNDGRFSRLRYEWKGEKGTDTWGCRAYATEIKTGDRLDGAWIDWALVQSEGWHKKTGSKWLTMPEQMFMYRAASFWERVHAPDISLGLQTAEEIEDYIEVTPTRVTRDTAKLNQDLAAEDDTPEDSPAAEARERTAKREAAEAALVGQDKEPEKAPRRKKADKAEPKPEPTTEPTPEPEALDKPATGDLDLNLE